MKNNFLAVFIFAALVSGCSPSERISSLFPNGLNPFSTGKAATDQIAPNQATASEDIIIAPAGKADVASEPLAEVKITPESALMAPAPLAPALMEDAPGTMPETLTGPAKQAANALPRPSSIPGQKTAPKSSAKSGGKLYLVLASCVSHETAAMLANRNPSLKAMVMKAIVNGRPMHRVVVGPVSPENGSVMRARLAAIGFKDAWPLFLNEKESPAQLAGLGLS